MSNINLLPWRVERTIYKNNIFYAMCGGVAIVAILLVIIVKLYMQIILANNKKNIDYLNAEINLYQSKTKEINGLKERKKLLLSRLEVINSLQSKRSNVVNILDKLVKAIPDGVILKQIDLKGNLLLVTGQSESNSRVSLFMRNLERLQIFASPTLQEIKAPQDAQAAYGVSFVLETKVLG